MERSPDAESEGHPSRMDPRVRAYIAHWLIEHPNGSAADAHCATAEWAASLGIAAPSYDSVRREIRNQVPPRAITMSHTAEWRIDLAPITTADCVEGPCWLIIAVSHRDGGVDAFQLTRALPRPSVVVQVVREALRSDAPPDDHAAGPGAAEAGVGRPPLGERRRVVRLASYPLHAEGVRQQLAAQGIVVRESPPLRPESRGTVERLSAVLARAITDAEPVLRSHDDAVAAVERACAAYNAVLRRRP